MRKKLLITVVSLLLLLSGCDSSNAIKAPAGGHLLYQYYDEVLNVIWKGNKPNKKASQECDSYMVIVYDRDNKPIETYSYNHLNDFDAKNDQIVISKNTYDDQGSIVSTKNYTYSYDGTLYSAGMTERIDEFTTKYMKFSIDGAETVMCYTINVRDENGELKQSDFYLGNGTLNSRQTWTVNDEGKRIYIMTEYNPDGTIAEQSTEVYD